MRKILVTGAAGFIGSHLAVALKQSGFEVLAIDNLKASYGHALPELRREELLAKHDIDVEIMDLAELARSELQRTLTRVDHVVHLAAFPGVRRSVVDPSSYTRNNIHAFANLMDAVAESDVKTFLYASSSSIYGDRKTVSPMKEDSATGSGLSSYYAATKWANEILARSHPGLLQRQVCALRFFTVYGPWGRPDMAYYSFAKAIVGGHELELFDAGSPRRDFTFVSDAVARVIQILELSDSPGTNLPSALNVGFGRSLEASRMVTLLSEHLGTSAKVKNVSRPKADVSYTWADSDLANSMLPPLEPVSLDEGLKQFCLWFTEFQDRL